MKLLLLWHIVFAFTTHFLTIWLAEAAIVLGTEKRDSIFIYIHYYKFQKALIEHLFLHVA